MFADCSRSWVRSESKSRPLRARTAAGVPSLPAWRARGTHAATTHSFPGPAGGVDADPGMRCRRRRSRCLLAQRVEQKRCVLRIASNDALHSAQAFPLTLVHRRGFTLRHDLAVSRSHGDGLGCQRCEGSSAGLRVLVPVWKKTPRLVFGASSAGSRCRDGSAEYSPRSWTGGGAPGELDCRTVAAGAAGEVEKTKLRPLWRGQGFKSP